MCFMAARSLSSLYHCYPSEWKKRILPGVSLIRSFWRRVRGHPLLDNHHALSRSSWQSLCIPISIHGDGVPVTGIAKSWSKAWKCCRGHPCWPLDRRSALSILSLQYFNPIVRLHSGTIRCGGFQNIGMEFGGFVRGGAPPR